MTTRRRSHPESSPPPPDLRAAVGRLGDQEVLVISWPVADRPDEAWPELTPAQREVAAMLVAGCSRADVARMRGRAPSTVAAQIAAIFARLGVGSRTELVALHISRRRQPQ
ncbi:MAG: helix-turn-helix transcriptional regulator [Deltaproteobacteria bacterium]|nr:helix-turn-helix transcriptional regulator [Deltaproteobacteria bacterium]